MLPTIPLVSKIHTPSSCVELHEAPSKTAVPLLHHENGQCAISDFGSPGWSRQVGHLHQIRHHTALGCHASITVKLHGMSDQRKLNGTILPCKYQPEPRPVVLGKRGHESRRNTSPVLCINEKLRRHWSLRCLEPAVGSKGTVPRPPNAFIIYRKEWHPTVVAENPGLHNNAICMYFTVLTSHVPH